MEMIVLDLFLVASDRIVDRGPDHSTLGLLSFIFHCYIHDFQEHVSS